MLVGRVIDKVAERAYQADLKCEVKWIKEDGVMRVSKQRFERNEDLNKQSELYIYRIILLLLSNHCSRKSLN